VKRKRMLCDQWTYGGGYLQRRRAGTIEAFFERYTLDKEIIIFI